MSKKLPPRVLLIEYDEIQNSTLSNSMERAWFDVMRARSARDALKFLEVEIPHIIVISSRIKDSSAIELADKFSKKSDIKEVPIVFLIGENEDVKHYKPVNSFFAIIKRPIVSSELLDQIRILLRKSKPNLQDKILCYQDITIDLATFIVTRGGRVIHFGPTEFKILQLFIQNPKQIYSRSKIIDFVWGEEKNIASRTIDVHVNRIRKLLKISEEDKPLIKTLRSAGYSLE